jgi:catechol 2,3-dioxygenase-like lactoylglutathione lyase family enzyme
MNSVLIRTMALVCLLAAPLTACAQLLATRDALVGYSHHHLNVTNVAAHLEFFGATLGGVPATAAGQQLVKFPNVFVFLRRQPPTGGSKGSTIDHIAFSVPNLAAVLSRVKANGYRVVASSASPGATALVMAPDQLQVELVEVKGQQAASALHHVHFNGRDHVLMQNWYGTMLRVKPKVVTGQTLSLPLPGGRLEFSKTRADMAATRGRVIDHIGFEVDNMELFLDRLEDIGAPQTVPGTMPGLGLPVASLADPWGTSIELTEGLDKIR